MKSFAWNVTKRAASQKNEEETQVGNKCNRVKGHAKINANDVIKN